MKYSSLPLITLLCIADCTSSNPVEDRGRHNWNEAVDGSNLNAPVAALESYKVALKSGDKAAAVKLTASFPLLSKEQVESSNANFVTYVKDGLLVIDPVAGAGKVDNDCAIVVFTDSKKDGINGPTFFPAFLIKQGGEWRVLLFLVKWDRPEFTTTTEQKKRFETLGKWFEEDMKRRIGR
jgi:hypothetical protein